VSVGLKLDFDPGVLYRQFHFANVKSPCVDIDKVELRGPDKRPAAVMETTYCTTNVRNPNFLKGVDARLTPHNTQIKMLIEVGDLLRVPAYVVGFDVACENFAVRMACGGDWHFADRDSYVKWLHSLKPPKEKT
jgi:hypothetical protein